jgi:hypothetical protein
VEKSRTPTRPEVKLPAYFYRLSARAQKIYLQSDAIARFELLPGADAVRLARSLMQALDSGASTIVQRGAQALIDELCRLAAMPLLRLEVRNVRPHNTRGELHGIFYPRGSAATPGAPLIILWMRTAQRHDVVKPKTFMRTLMHEFSHYLDYALLRLGDSPHTSGFFKRESFLVRTLVAQTMT